MSLTLPIVIDKRYMRRDGFVITARPPHHNFSNRCVYVGTSSDDVQPVDHLHVHIAHGRVHAGDTNPTDLVADYVETRTPPAPAVPAAPFTAHPHAALMALYAQDAAESYAPWERWEYRNSPLAEWAPHSEHPRWFTNCEYRRKPKTIRIGEFDVPEPLREAPAAGTEYFVATLSSEDVATPLWESDHHDLRWLKWGLVHLTREAAELHARALISLTEQK